MIYFKCSHSSSLCSIKITFEHWWIRINCCCTTLSITVLSVLQLWEIIFWWNSLINKSLLERADDDDDDDGNTVVKISLGGNRYDNWLLR